MKKAQPLLMVILMLSLGLATNAQAALHWPWHRTAPAVASDPITAVHAAAAQLTGTAAAPDPFAAETKPVDLIVKTVLTPTFVEHANKALTMAGTSDPMFSQCVQFGLTLRQELTDNPLISVSKSPLVTADLSCPLCLLEAKRQDVELIQSGVLAARVATVRTRVRDIKKRYHMACGPLVMDETDVAGQAFDFFAGLLGH